MPPRVGRSRNTNYDPVNTQSLAQPHPSEGPSPMGTELQGEPSLGQVPGHARPYTAVESQFRDPIVVEQPFIPDIPVSILSDPRSKMLLKGSLAKLAKEAAPGAKLDDDATELLLYVANDFLSSLANFSCRLASHRGSENLDARDVELYLEQMHGMHISLVASPLAETPSDPLTPPPPTSATPGQNRKREPSPPLAQTRPRRHTNTAPPEEDTEEEDGDDGTEGGDNVEENESEGERPRESKRLRERAIAAEKQAKQRKRGKVGRPRK